MQTGAIQRFNFHTINTECKNRHIDGTRAERVQHMRHQPGLLGDVHKHTCMGYTSKQDCALRVWGI